MTASHSILSQMSHANQRPRFQGRIRAGTKALSKAAGQNPLARQIYNEQQAKGVKRPEIERLIEQQTGIKNATYPVNTPYFNVVASDFPMPEIADMIMNNFGEVQGDDPQTRLYRFPVVFHSEVLNEIYPNSFRQGAGQPGYQSKYGDDGCRYCQYRPPVDEQTVRAQRARRIKHVPPREFQVRGLCEPGVCLEFQQGQCKFSGQLLFYIPSIPTTGLVCMETSSASAAEGIYATLDQIQRLLGRIPRFHPLKPDQPVFFLTKVQEQRAYFNESGERKTGLQWVPRLILDADIAAFLKLPLQLSPPPTIPVHWLAHAAPVAPTTQTAATPESVPPSAPSPIGQLDILCREHQLDIRQVHEYLSIKLGLDWSKNSDLVRQGWRMVKNLTLAGDDCAALMMQITVEASMQNIPAAQVNLFALGAFGKGFTKRHADLQSLLHTLKNSPETVCQNEAEIV